MWCDGCTSAINSGPWRCAFPLIDAALASRSRVRHADRQSSNSLLAPTALLAMAFSLISLSVAIPRCVRRCGRTGKQCRERWHNQLDPAIKKHHWSAEEDRILLEAHRQLGVAL